MRFLACDTGLKSIHPMKRYSIDGLGSTVCKDSTRIYLIFESGLIAGGVQAVKKKNDDANSTLGDSNLSKKIVFGANAIILESKNNRFWVTKKLYVRQRKT